MPPGWPASRRHGGCCWRTRRPIPGSTRTFRPARLLSTAAAAECNRPLPAAAACKSSNALPRACRAALLISSGQLFVGPSHQLFGRVLIVRCSPTEQFIGAGAASVRVWPASGGADGGEGVGQCRPAFPLLPERPGRGRWWRRRRRWWWRWRWWRQGRGRGWELWYVQVHDGCSAAEQLAGSRVGVEVLWRAGVGCLLREERVRWPSVWPSVALLAGRAWSARDSNCAPHWRSKPWRSAPHKSSMAMSPSCSWPQVPAERHPAGPGRGLLVPPHSHSRCGAAFLHI